MYQRDHELNSGSGTKKNATGQKKRKRNKITVEIGPTDSGPDRLSPNSGPNKNKKKTSKNKLKKKKGCDNQ